MTTSALGGRHGHGGGGKRTRARSWGTLCRALGFLCCLVFMYVSFGVLRLWTAEPGWVFAARNGTHLVVGGGALYVNGWNSYWLMEAAVEESGRSRVTEIFRTASRMGFTVCRTWAFKDGGRRALQVSLGIFDERVFKALDWIIAEARKHGIRLILSFVNNFQQNGGKSQYVSWGLEEGFGLSPSNDSFFFHPSLRSYFKIYLKTILTRKNHLTGIEYRDDPTIFAWELMNAPQCASDASGDTLQEWIEEMADHVKEIDKNHLLTVGLEGFYGSSSSSEKKKLNPSKYYAELGTDFLRNSKTPSIDFASVHVYPDQWLPEANFTEKTNYVSRWMKSHIEDGEKELKKPILFTEYGVSGKNEGFRVAVYKSVLDTVYESATRDGAGAGAFIRQLVVVGGMERHNDDLDIILAERPAVDVLLREQACRLAALRYGKDVFDRSGAVC